MINVILIDDQFGTPDSTFTSRYGVLESRDASFRFHYSTAMGDGDYSVQAGMDAVAAVVDLRAVLLDIKFGRNDRRLGLEILQEIREQYPLLPVVMLTSLDSDIGALEASMRLGANDYLVKNPSVTELERTLNMYTRAGVEDADYTIWGNSSAIRQLRARIARMAAGQLSVLICGETGTGKELVARTIHRLGPRRNKPFVAKNCAYADSSLVEAEFFGQEEGSYTNATSRQGLVQQAEGGVLFLDEISKIPLPLQGQLLRLLENKEYKPVGASATRRADIQILCATNQNLSELVADGKIQEDFFHRINRQEVVCPPLRDRRSDIGILAVKLLERFKAREGGVFEAERLSLDALELLGLCNYHWQGNVRTLRNLVETWVADTDASVIEVADVAKYLVPDESPQRVQGPSAESDSIPAPPPPLTAFDLPGHLAKQELIFLQQAYIQTTGNKTAVVKLLYPGKQSNHFRRVVFDCFSRYANAAGEFPDFVADFQAEQKTRSGAKTRKKPTTPTNSDGNNSTN